MSDTVLLGSSATPPAADKPPSPAPALEPLLIPDTVAAALCGISRAHWHRLRAAGKLGPQAIRLGRKLLFDREEVIAWTREVP